MKNFVLAASLLLAAASAATATAAVTVSIGQPGFYGRIDVGNYPAPELIYAQPVIVERPQYSSARPIYLRVPPGHAKNWSKHCRRYNACNQEVYFVQDGWYNKQYAPRYRQEHARPTAHRPPPPHGRPGPERHDERRDDRRDDGPGKGHGHDNGRGNGNGNNGHRN